MKTFLMTFQFPKNNKNEIIYKHFDTAYQLKKMKERENN